MNPTGQIGEKRAFDSGYDATLHMVTHAAAPAGLEERVHAVLEAAPRRGWLLEWPVAAGWMRATAAAAIVGVVAGGGWGVYWHAQLHQPAKVNAMPAPQLTAPAMGGFSSSGAMRTPQTVKGPAVVVSKPRVVKKHSAMKRIPAWNGAPARTSPNSATKSAKKHATVKPIPARKNLMGQGTNSTGIAQ